MTANDTLDRLLREAQDGDRKAFDQLITHLETRLDSLIESRLGQGLRVLVDTEDVKQEILSHPKEPRLGGRVARAG